MAQSETITLQISPDIMEHARMTASISGQQIEAVLMTWLERGAAITARKDQTWDIGSPIEAPEAAALLLKLLEDNRTEET